jgi:cell division protein FtsW
MSLTSEDRILNYFKAVLFVLVVFGMIMIYSSSYIFAKEEFGSSLHFILRQAIYAIAGVGILVAVSKTKFEFWYKNSYLFLLFASVFVGLTLVPGMAMAIKGSTRWLNLFGFAFQPGEILKYLTLLCAVHYFENFSFFSLRERLMRFAFLMFPIFMLLFQPDFGMFSLCMINLFYVCFLSPFPRKYFYGFIASGGVLLLLVLASAPYRVKRVMTYLDPWSDPLNSGFQIIQSFLAFANGSLLGLGLGNSNEKLFYLPEAHNDFILSVIAEELGFVGVTFVVLLFFSFIFLGFRLAIKAQSTSRVLFSLAAIFAIGTQAFLNMGVVLGLLPTKGLNLPFISYGGSSLLSNFFLLGLFFSAISAKELSPNVTRRNPTEVKKRVGENVTISV